MMWVLEIFLSSKQNRLGDAEVDNNIYLSCTLHVHCELSGDSALIPFQSIMQGMQLLPSGMPVTMVRKRFDELQADTNIYT